MSGHSHWATIKRGKEAEDKKRGISQSDMYQMVSYAVRSKCRNIHLYYPATLEDFDEFGNYISTPSKAFHVHDEFTFIENSEIINIKISAHKIPIIHQDIFNINTRRSLNEIFSKAETTLRNVIIENLELA